jgi:hypothetical protein
MWRSLLVAVAGIGVEDAHALLAAGAGVAGRDGGAASCWAGAQALKQSRTSSLDVAGKNMVDSVTKEWRQHLALGVSAWNLRLIPRLPILRRFAAC